ncbi:hypothetical protein ACP4OV_029070 [Aristida adscensionis]
MRGDHPPVEPLHTSPPAMSAVEASRGLGAVLDYLREDPIGHTIHPASLRPPSHPSSSSAAAAAAADDHATKWVLLDLTAYIADRRNASTAASFTRAGHAVHATLCAARPPRVTLLCVHCPALPASDFGAEPRVVATAAGGLVLLHAAVCNPSVAFETAMQDLFVYRASPPSGSPPSLAPLPRPPAPCLFLPSNVGILPCGDGRYVIAMLHPVSHSAGEVGRRCSLTRFRSGDGEWSTTALDVGRLPPSPGLTSFCHISSKVIALGGGFMGWVDLARGILLCDVLADDPELHYIPLPPAAAAADAVNGGRQLTGTTARASRDVAVVQGYIKLVVHHAHVRPGSFRDGTYVSDDWTATTFGRKIDLGCWEGGRWQEHRRCNASDVAGSLPELLGCKLSLPALQRLRTGLPTQSLEEDDEIYFLAKIDHRDDQGFVIAVNLRDGALQGAECFVTEKTMGISLTYAQCLLSDDHL